MRILLALALAACADPTGLAQTWPPSRGIVVEAIVAGDLDADGATDLLLYGSGDSHQAGIYRIEGSELALGDAQPVHSFTTFAPLPFGHPSAGTAVDVGGMAKVFAAYYAPAIHVGAYDATLAMTATLPADLPAGNATLWMRPLVVPNDQPRLAVSNGTRIQQSALDGSDAHPLLSPVGQAWSDAAVATTFAQGANVDVVVATPTQVFTALAPDTNTSNLTWATVRDGPVWVGQVALDLGATHDFIVGLDLAQGAVCAIDPNGGQPVCLALGSVSSNVEVGIVQVRTALGYTLVITQSDSATTEVKVVESVVASQVDLTGTVTAHAPVAVGHARPVVVTTGAGATTSVLVVGRDGSIGCAVGC
jgi:hypothetical protein